jgi:hypothetical protein
MMRPAHLRCTAAAAAAAAGATDAASP